MSTTIASVLVVDDEPLIRSSMALILTQVGYRVRSARDGFSALVELRNEVPDVLLSDLNMPGMTGFELLPVVRCCFPSVWRIAMSGAFSGHFSALAADAFYQKGDSVKTLLGILENISQSNRFLPHGPSFRTTAPPQKKTQRSSGDAGIALACADCLPTLPQISGGLCSPVPETDCFYCRQSISHTAVQSSGRGAQAGLSLG
jgi:DNA-binding NarL/FixJ family response regulator